jgi:glycosyltransferase involved in cell wall biosynthesis
MSKVSVITINYNGSQFLERCINSIINQFYDNWEHIIIDCGSTDDSLNKLKLLSHSKLIVKEIGFCSVSDGRNFAIDHASGHFCAILDVDDVALPNRLSDQINLFKLNKNLTCVGGSFYAVIKRVGFWRNLILSNYKLVNMPSHNHELVSMLNVGLNPIVHSALMFDKSVFYSIGQYRTSMEKSEDFDLVLRFSKVGCLGSATVPISELYFGVPNSHTVRHRPKGMGPLHFVFIALLENSDFAPKIVTNVDIICFMEKVPESILSGLQSKLILSFIFGKQKLSPKIRRIYLIVLFRNCLFFISLLTNSTFRYINNLQGLSKLIKDFSTRN